MFSADGAVLKGEVVYGKAQIQSERTRTDRRTVKAIENTADHVIPIVSGNRYRVFLLNRCF